MAQIEFEMRVQPSGRSMLAESPVWDAETGDWWWVDIPGRQILRRPGESDEVETWDTPEETGFIVLTDQGPAAGMETGIYAFDPRWARFDRMVAFDDPGCRFNDATVDATGRLWASTMHKAAEPGRGRLHCVGPGLNLHMVSDGLTIPNGLAHDTAGGRLFWSDSYPEVQTIWTAPLDLTTSALGAATVFAKTTDLPGRPDGAAMDADGNYWIAAVDGCEIYVFSADGTLAHRHKAPVQFPTKIGFGGPDGRGIALTSKADAQSGGYLACATLPTAYACGIPMPRWVPGA